MDHQQRINSLLIPFYLGVQTDPEGRKIQEIWAWDFEELECAHDYIQWLFPIAEKSTFNPDAPVVDDQIIQTFHKDPRLSKNLQQSLTVMLRFYGLHRYETNPGKIVIGKSKDYATRKQEWLHRFDHNFLRITRILKCLMILGLKAEAQGFYDCLQQLYQEDGDQIGGETFQYWTNALKPDAAVAQF